jgi:glycosyltransferase involved in cell wall biosynthesis
MKKILQVVDTLGQGFGVTSVVLNYYRNIDRDSVQFDFLVLEDSDKRLVAEITFLGGTVFFMQPLSLLGYRPFIVFLKTFFQEHHAYLAVHSHFNQIDAILFPLAKKAGIRNCISHSHNTRYSDSLSKSFRDFLLCLPQKKSADYWFACSNVAGRFLFGTAFSTSPKSHVLHNAIDCDRFAYRQEVRAETRKTLGFQENEFVVGTVGRFKPQKNQEYLLKIYSSLLRIDPSKNYRMVLVGDGELKEKLEKRSKLLGLEQSVTFTGQRKDIPEILQAFDCFVLPSRYEGLPVIGIEAQAAGLPCLFSSKVTKEAEICNVSFLDLKKDPFPWVQSIIDLSENFSRYNTNSEVAQAGYDIKKEAGKLLEFYMQLSDSLQG